MTPLRRLLPCLVFLAVTIPVRAADTDKYLPDRTQGVITLHVKQVLQSPLLKEHSAAIKKACWVPSAAPSSVNPRRRRVRQMSR